MPSADLVEIAPDIYWLNGGSSNFYLCAEPSGLTLIDCGMPRKAPLVWTAVAQLGRQKSELRRLVITHADIDHAGSAAAIQAQTGCEIIASQETAALLAQGKSPKHMPALVQFFLNHIVRYGRVAHNVTLMQDGDLLPILGGLQVIATPGHTPDHHALYCATSGVLFAGDALNTNDDTLQASPDAISADTTAVRRSAIKLLSLSATVIACGHGRPLRNHTADQTMALFNDLRQKERSNE